jgi:hypothetical protein
VIFFLSRWGMSVLRPRWGHAPRAIVRPLRDHLTQRPRLRPVTCALWWWSMHMTWVTPGARQGGGGSRTGRLAPGPAGGLERPPSVNHLGDFEIIDFSPDLGDFGPMQGSPGAGPAGLISDNLL